MRYGVNGDPLREGKLDLPELLEVPIPAALAGYEIEAVSLDDFDHLLVEVTR